MIELFSVGKEYAGGGQRTSVLRDISLRIEEGDLVALVGPSGSGKTTLMNILGCLDRPTAGRYEFDGNDVVSLSDVEISRLRNEKIGFVFQSFHLLPRLRVIDNVLLPLMYSAHYPADANDRAATLLDLVGLTNRRNYLPSQLSGGQQQRVAIARSLITAPRVVLADEPTGNLDSESGNAILELFRTLNGAGYTIVVVTHSSSTAAIARRRIELHDGVITSDTRVQL